MEMNATRKMTTETFELFGNDAKKYVELDPDIELQDRRELAKMYPGV